MVTVKLNINGQDYEVGDLQDRLLLYVLRDDLGLVGTRFGCGIGQCGSCTVWVDGAATRACVTLARTVVGKTITTIEGLAATAPGRPLHPVQQAFVDEQVPQCGWCIPGQIMTAAAFLEKNPSPTDDEIVAALERNYCRCGTYPRIKRAVRRAAEEMAE